MSVFKAIKGTLINVQQDISSGIRSLTTRESIPSEEIEECERDSAVEIEAGGDVLEYYQSKWASIHSSSEENAKLAKKCDGQIGELFLYLERQSDAMNQFYGEVSTLPKLVAEVKQVMDKIGELEGMFEDMETDLAELDEICEEVELHNNKVHHQKQLRLYSQRKHMDLEQTKLELASKHAQKVQKYEAKLQGNIREKQEAFEFEYRKEIEKYKKFGETDFKPSPQPHQKVSLADIEIDEDKAELDAFLETSDEHKANIPDTTQHVHSTPDAVGDVKVVGDETQPDPTAPEGAPPSPNPQITPLSEDVDPEDSLPSNNQFSNPLSGAGDQ